MVKCGFKNKNPKGMCSKEIGLRAKILVNILGSKSHINPHRGGEKQIQVFNDHENHRGFDNE